MNKDIKKVLDEYKEPIDSKKPDDLSVSTYRVDKPWGYELWLELNEFYAYKLIHMKSGNRSSLQSHKHKIETNYVIRGERIVINDKKPYGDMVVASGIELKRNEGIGGLEL